MALASREQLDSIISHLISSDMTLQEHDEIENFIQQEGTALLVHQAKLCLAH